MDATFFPQNCVIKNLHVRVYENGPFHLFILPHRRMSVFRDDVTVVHAVCSETPI